MKIKLLCASALTAAAVAFAAPALATTVTFTEVPMNSGDTLTNQYAAYGLNFSNAYFYVDNRDTFDGKGFAGLANPTDVVFDNAVNGLSFDYVGLSGSSFTVEAYSAANVLLQSAAFGLFGSNTNASFALSANGVKTLRFITNTGQDGFSTLTFNAGGVPEPATWALMIMGFGLAGMAVRGRKAQATAA